MDETYLELAVNLARNNVVTEKGRPFGALVVRNGSIIATGVNELVQTGDPTTHAEMQAIRAAVKSLGVPRLDGATIYASGLPCPMCLAAMYMTGVRRVCYAYSAADGEPFGFTGASVYKELAKPFSEQSIACEHVPLSHLEEELYPFWKRLQIVE